MTTGLSTRTDRDDDDDDDDDEEEEEEEEEEEGESSSSPYWKENGTSPARRVNFPEGSNGIDLLEPRKKRRSGNLSTNLGRNGDRGAFPRTSEEAGIGEPLHEPRKKRGSGNLSTNLGRSGDRGAFPRTSEETEIGEPFHDNSSAALECKLLLIYKLRTSSGGGGASTFEPVAFAARAKCTTKTTVLMSFCKDLYFCSEVTPRCFIYQKVKGSRNDAAVTV
ncbi:hypothetical protein BV898_03593 [Hypsibius exemplaris]|uniref:Uncharacterized protein n=1 Tax=Hypsibius exemplaris TaxID=2072580 RepID=A0A1W0X4K0_HYPEX|nr:hypothetical protein BV898_03593 [Hypsibius exemplaris]